MHALSQSQEPLYLPNNSELQVSIWRVTNTRQVWYEWHAESFISVPKTASANEDLLLPQPSASLQSASSSFSSFGAPSPLVDSKEPIFLDTRRLNVNEQGNSVTADYEIVKIGHTSLHNAGGRSSWIGL